MSSWTAGNAMSNLRDYDKYTPKERQQQKQRRRPQHYGFEQCGDEQCTACKEFKVPAEPTDNIASRPGTELPTASLPPVSSGCDETQFVVFEWPRDGEL